MTNRSQINRFFNRLDATRTRSWLLCALWNVFYVRESLDGRYNPMMLQKTHAPFPRLQTALFDSTPVAMIARPSLCDKKLLKHTGADFSSRASEKSESTSKNASTSARQEKQASFASPASTLPKPPTNQILFPRLIHPLPQAPSWKPTQPRC